MWYSNAGDKKCCTVMLGTGNAVQHCWGQEMCVQYFWGQEMCYSNPGDRKFSTVLLWTEIWYSDAGDRKSCTVLLGTGNVIQYCWVQEM
jgi:hypothetical protein